MPNLTPVKNVYFASILSSIIWQLILEALNWRPVGGSLARSKAVASPIPAVAPEKIPSQLSFLFYGAVAVAQVVKLWIATPEVVSSSPFLIHVTLRILSVDWVAAVIEDIFLLSITRWYFDMKLLIVQGSAVSLVWTTYWTLNPTDGIMKGSLVSET